MKPATLAAKNTVMREHAVGAQPRLRAEWEYNRYQIPTVTVSPTQEGDDEWLVNFGDSASIVMPNRPRTGIAKARLDSNVKPVRSYRDTANEPRFYPCSPDDAYRYFSSIERTKLVTNVAGNYEFDEPIQVTVEYPEVVAANKLVVGFETSYAKPTELTIEVSPNGVSWITAVVNPVVNPDGTVSIWYAKNEWDIAPDYEWPVVIKAVRLNVYAMDKPYQHVDILQVGARLENDLTAYLISYATQLEVSDRSFIAPLGKASENTASITLSNIDGRFNTNNPDSLYYGMIDKKVKMILDIGIDAMPQSGSKYEYIREFTGWTENWGGQESTSVEVELKDSSVFLQEVTMPVFFFEDMTAGAIIWTILDQLGFANYKYSRATNDLGQTIPFYWPEDDTSVWEEFGNIAEATQTAIYFDENDVLQIKARRAMYADKAVDWNFDAIQNGQKLPDIVTVEVDHDLEVNQVDVLYQPAHYSDYAKGIPKMEVAWEPEDDLILRGSPLQKDLTLTGTDLWITQAEASFWPFESLVNIRGEILRYKGKEYVYYVKEGTVQQNGTITYSYMPQMKIIYSLDEQKALDASSAEEMAWKNAYTGRFKVTERGTLGSGKASHLTTGDSTTYTSLLTNMGNTVTLPYSGGAVYKDGYIQQVNGLTDAATWHLRKHGSQVGAVSAARSVWYGTKIRFPSFGQVTDNDDREGNQPAPWQIGGLFFAGDALDGGYYLDISPTLFITKMDKRANRNELCLYRMPANGVAVPILSNHNAKMNVKDKDGNAVPNDTKGWSAGIKYDNFYDVDVMWAKGLDNNVKVTAFLNGVWAGDWDIPAAQAPANAFRFGTIVRGDSHVDFEYLYAVARIDPNETANPDNSTFFDLKSGGYVSGYIQREWRYCQFQYVNPSVKFASGVYYFPQNVYMSDVAYDEFGPVVHEIREFDVEFKDESRPVGHSRIYMSNISECEILYYNGDAFGAKFMLANAARKNAILKGDDNTILGADNQVNQQFFIYGRAVYQDEEKTLTKTDDKSLRIRGATKTEIQSRHVQTEDMATALGDWIIELWASGVDEVTLETFGNPFIQLGDLVTINYPIKDMRPSTHKYFVVSIQNEFDSGYKSTLVLRRARV